MSNNPKTIGVFFGSRSPEHDVSIITGQLIIHHLQKLGFKVVPVYIAKTGAWFSGTPLSQLNFFKDLTDQKLKPFGNWSLDLSQSAQQMILKRKKLFRREAVAIDVIFPAFHGPLGEDGSFQGLCEMVNVPYVGCNVPASAISMDKILTKIMFQNLNIPTPKFIAFPGYKWRRQQDAILKDIEDNLTFPVFAKAPHLGSSIGISKINHPRDITEAVEVILKYDDRVLVEEGVSNLKDLTCAVLGASNGDAKPSLVQESAYTKDLFSYEDKYLKDGGAQLGQNQASFYIPARLPENITKQIQGYTVQIYQALDLFGNCRVDFLYNETTKELFANEINPLPGTLYHHLWQKSGVNVEEVIEIMVKGALSRHQATASRISTFASTLLSQAHSQKLSPKLNSD